MSSQNLLIGGKLGDFLLGVYGAYLHHQVTGEKVDIHMMDIGWEFGIQQTYKDLYPLLMSQEYVSDVQILTDYLLDPIQTPYHNSPVEVYNNRLLQEGYMVDDYLNSPLLYKACWTDIYTQMYKTTPKPNTAWLTHNTVDPEFGSTVVIHRKSAEGYDPSTKLLYERVLETYDSVVFAGTSEEQYRAFEWKDSVPFLKVANLEQWFTVINSCAMYVGNLTGPVVIAQALDKPRIVELPSNVDAYHWIGEEKYSTNFNWFLNQHSHNLKTS